MVGRARRGPRRSEEARIAILTAAADRVAKDGYDHLTIEGVAHDARVGKQTIYRYWKSRSALVADCLNEGLLFTDFLVPDNSGDLRADVAAWLRNIVGVLRNGNAGLLRSLVIAAAEDADVAAGLNDRLGIPQMLGERFGAAIEAGQLPPDTPVVELGDALIGAIVLRDLRQEAEDPGAVGRLVDLLLPPPRPG